MLFRSKMFKYAIVRRPSHSLIDGISQTPEIGWPRCIITSSAWDGMRPRLRCDSGWSRPSGPCGFRLSKAGKNNLICMNVKGDVVTIISNSEEGDVREELTVEKEGDDIEIGFNAQYIIDVLKNIEDKEIRMLFNEPVKPCLIEPLEGRDYEYLVLPVRI